MGMVITRSDIRGVKVWDMAASRQVGQTAVAAIAQRAFKRGQDTSDAPFQPYGTNPIYVSKKNARLKPRGGEKTPRKGGKGKKRRTGRSVYYPGGYRQYKADTTGSDKVNLVLSGQLLRSLAPVKVTTKEIQIGVRGGAARHGAYLQVQHKTRPARKWLGLSPRDRQVVATALRTIFRGVQTRQRGAHGR